jgi:UDP-glucose 4-epimerase
VIVPGGKKRFLSDQPKQNLNIGKQRMSNESKYKKTAALLDWAKSARSLPMRFRLTRLPIIGKVLFKDSFVGDPSTKAWLVPVHENISIPGNVHLPLDVIRPLIEKSAHRASLNGCVCREAFDCKTFAHEIGCLFLGRAFKDPIKTGMISLTVEEALNRAEEAVRLGLVPTIIWERENQTLFGAPMNSGLAICFCCDCCCDYRMGLRLGNKAFKKKVFRPEGVSVVVSEACELCGDCAEPEVCSAGAITLGVTSSMIDLEKCVGCGHCILICPNRAITFQLDPQIDVVGRLLAKVEEFTSVE